MRFHLLALPNAPTSHAFSLDGFAQATMRFARMLKALGHVVFLYGAEGNTVQVDEFIQVITDEERLTLLGPTEYQHAAMEERWPLWALSNPRIAKEIGKRKQPRDFICCIGGASQQPIAQAHPDLMFVEYSIGYNGSFSPYRVFESHVWRHCTYGFQGTGDGRFFDDVIPVFFDETEFKFRNEKEPFALYVGRLIERKGLGIACRAAEAAGIPLKVAGHGDVKLITHGAEYVGTPDMLARNDLMSRAQVVLCPTQYIEPFCCVSVEAQLCGTPVVSTDFGAFVENVEHGQTGFRCRYMGEFARGIQDAAKLHPDYIRQRAIAKYSMHNLKHDYQRYFERLMLLWDGGFNSLN